MHKPTQEEMKIARTNGDYEQIWQNTGKCVFCDLKSKYIIREENGIVLTVSLFPYTDGHLLAIPKRHILSPKELSPSEWETIRKFGYISRKLIKKTHKIKSMWTMIREGNNSGKSVSGHLHIHFIPVKSADFAIFNYEELKNTPIENANIYMKLSSEIVKIDQKYSKKYSNSNEFKLIVDALIFNEKGEICLQRRSKNHIIAGTEYVLPGGHVDSNQEDLETELARELKEELDLQIDKSNLALISSRISNLTYISNGSLVREQIIWNTYKYTLLTKTKIINNTDECDELLWLTKSQILNLSDISEELKEVIAKA